MEKSKNNNKNKGGQDIQSHVPYGYISISTKITDEIKLFVII